MSRDGERLVDCPKCDGMGDFYGRECRMCGGSGRVHEDAASEYVFSYERESLEARDV